MPVTLKDMLATGADVAPAISAPGRQALTFSGLRDLTAQTLAALNALGIAATTASPSCWQTDPRWRLATSPAPVV